jgi:inorganic pyrophosphatase
MHNSEPDHKKSNRKNAAGSAPESGPADFSQLVQNVSSSIIALARDLPELAQKVEALGPSAKRDLVQALRPLQAAANEICGVDARELEQLMLDAKLLFKSHPWHGVSIGSEAPHIVRSYIEIVPTDTLKYEVDKPTGALKADRPQMFSSVCPASYGFLPQTYCGDKVGELCAKRTKRKNIVGDGDPLDVCVLSSHAIPHGDFILEVIPIGGFRMIDKNQADDKIIAVMKGDPAYGHFTNIGEVPRNIISKLEHYFLTYKEIPGKKSARVVDIAQIYGAKEAHLVIKKSQEDYRDKFPGLVKFTDLLG